jgi:hypothetical protein
VLRKSALIVAALAFVAGAVAFLRAGRMGQASGPTAQVHTHQGRVEGTGGLEFQRVSESRSEVGSGALEVDAAEDPLTDEREEFGRVIGRVYDIDGAPVPHIPVSAFGVDHDVLRTEPSAQADGDGYYTLERVPVGTWLLGADVHSEVRRRNPPGVEDVEWQTVVTPPVHMTFGQIEVSADETVVFDLVMRGERTLDAHFYFAKEEDEGTLLVIALHELGTGALVARVSTAHASNDLGSDTVRFSGLYPDVYEMRIALDTVENPGTVYFSKEVDLTAGDLDLGKIELTFDQFIWH